ncbi:10864_t:CDS:1, partial [Scutellospora calospora]
EVFDVLCQLMCEETEEEKIDHNYPTPQLSESAQSSLDTDSNSDNDNSIKLNQDSERKFNEIQVTGLEFYKKVEVVRSIPKEEVRPQDNKTCASNIIRLEHFALISTWIDQSQTYKQKIFKLFTPPKKYLITNFPYDFTLLTRGSQDGFTSSAFHQK